MTEIIVSITVPDHVKEFRYIIECLKNALDNGGFKWIGIGVESSEQ